MSYLAAIFVCCHGNRGSGRKIFNIFLTAIGPDLAKSINVSPKASVCDYLTSKNKKSVFQSPVDESDSKNVTNFRLDKSVIASIAIPATHIYM